MRYFNNIFCCPVCLSDIRKIKSSLVCVKKGHRFKIEQGIPILLDYSNIPMHSQKQQFYFEKNLECKDISSLTNLSYWKVKYLERFNQNFKNIKNKLICEGGTGSGYMSIGLAKLGAKVLACDITIKNLLLLKKASKKLGCDKNILFVCCSVHQLPFKGGSFDFFVLNSVLEHIPEEMKTISEIRRTLKSGGGLMITVPVKYKYIFPLLIPLNYFHDKRIGHLRRYNLASLVGKFSNFSLKQVYFTGHPLKVVKVIINMVIKIFNEKDIEEDDAKKDGNIMWSSNLIAFFTKKTFKM